MAINTNSYIHFRKTDAVNFAKEFSLFSDWLYKKDGSGNFVNIVQNADGTISLSRTRERELPKFANVTADSSLYSTYFLDDIKVIYYCGIPYDSATDYITGAEYTDSSVLSVDDKRHILLIPKPIDSQESLEDKLSVAYIHQLDATGVYNPSVADSSITVYVKGVSGKTFTIKQTNPEGATTDSVDTKSYWGLRNYIDSRLKNVDVEEIIDTEWKDEK